MQRNLKWIRIKAVENTMSYFRCCLALAALPVLCAAAEVTPVALFTHFEQPPAPRVADSIRHEVENIMAPLGFPLQWISLDGVRGDDVATALAVVTFRGNCGVTDFLTDGKTTPLGFTHVSDGIVLPFTEIDCEATRNFLRRELMRVQAQQRETDLGRAIGRVLAHELFHVFASTAHHGSDGIAKSTFAEHELMAQHFTFEPAEFRALRASLRQARQENRRLRAAASPLSGRFIFQEDGCAKCHGKVGQCTKTAPALRSTTAPPDVKALAARLVAGALRMRSRAQNVMHSPVAPLDDDEIADVASFLSSLD